MIPEDFLAAGLRPASRRGASSAGFLNGSEATLWSKARLNVRLVNWNSGQSALRVYFWVNGRRLCSKK